MEAFRLSFREAVCRLSAQNARRSFMLRDGVVSSIPFPSYLAVHVPKAAA